jgi:hypothetical protein
MLRTITLRGPSLFTIEPRNADADPVERALTGLSVRDALMGHTEAEISRTDATTYPTLTFATVEGRFFVQMTPGVAAELAEALLALAREQLDNATPRPDGFAPGFDFTAPTCPKSWHVLGDHLANRDGLACSLGHTYGRAAVAPNGSLRIPLHNDTPKEQTS